jgi:parallel beta-helix repeat protein
MNFGTELAQGTNVGGKIGTDTTWNFAGSPYIVIDDVIVESSATLTIDPGVIVKFNGNYGIYVDGNLLAIGLESFRINITSNQASPMPRDWETIQINGYAEIKNCDISYGTNSIVIFSSSNNEITDNNIFSNINAITLELSSLNTIIGNNISNNRQGIYIQSSSNNNISSNTILSNNGWGVWLASSWNNTLFNNIFIDDGLIILGDQLSHFNSHTIPISNNVNGKPLYYYKDTSSVNIVGIPVGQLFIINSTNFYVSNLQIESTDLGIEIAYSNNINLIDNDLLNNSNGIRIYFSSNINITGNNVPSIGSIGIFLHSSNNNILTNNKVFSSPFSNGIRLEYSSNNIITGNDVSGCVVGIYLLDFSINNSVSGNNVSSNAGGIGLSKSSYNKISYNNVSYNSIGLKCLPSSNNNIIISNNISLNNIYGVYIEPSFNNNITNNYIFNNGNPANGGGIYLESLSNSYIINNNISSNSWYGIYLDSSSYNNFTGNIILNNDYGLYLSSSNLNHIISNDISMNNIDGIFLGSSSNNNFANNHISDNLEGINVSSSSNNNNIIANIASNNDYGIYIGGSIDNNIYHNNILNNSNQAYDNSNNSNQWDNGYPSGGNYWSDYTGIDMNSTPSQNVPPPDGIGDIPYVIDPDSQDNYPLWEPLFISKLPLLPPFLFINVSLNGEDIILNWESQSKQKDVSYLIYRSTDPTTFDFSNPWVNSLTDKEPGEPSPIPDRTMWNDTNAANPENTTNYNEQYYYVIRAFNGIGEVSSTSRTVGKWTKTFSEGISTFSLPLESIEPMDTDFYTSTMNTDYIKYIDPVNYTWKQHNFGDGNTNNTEMKPGEGYEVKFSGQTNYTFLGMPGAMISYDNDTGFSGFNSSSDSRNLTVSIEPNGDVNLNWQEPMSMSPGGWYEIYYSNVRDGFFGTRGIDFFDVWPQVNFGNNTTTHTNAQANTPGARLYYMIVPYNASGVRGTSTYSIGIWTEEFLNQYDTLGIPLKVNEDHSADWFCDNIPDSVGINYFDFSQQKWGWHSTRMSEGAFDPVLEMTVGYQISTSGSTKFTFIGI